MDQQTTISVFQRKVSLNKKNYAPHEKTGVLLTRKQSRRSAVHMLMDQVDTLYVDRYWSQVLCNTIMTLLDDLEVKVMDLEILR